MMVVIVNCRDQEQTLGNTTTTMNTSASEPISLSSYAKPLQHSSDYSTVIDALGSSAGRMQSVSKKCPPLVKGSKSTDPHPFSSATNATTSASKLPANQKRSLRPAPPIPIIKQSETDPKLKGELEHSYAHIVDGLSPPEEGNLSTSPPHTTAAKKTTAKHNTTVTSDSATSTTTATAEEIEGYLYSTPVPNGMKNYRRMTGSQGKDAKPAKVKKEKYIRPQSALGLYPPLEDIYTSSCTSSLSSVRKKTRPVSAYYNEPV